VAAAAERILAGTADVRVLVASRESLRVCGERVYRLPTLDCPPVAPLMTAREALDFPAVALFVDRAADWSPGFRLEDQDVAQVAHICRRLDGLPLALEIAATGIDAFGLKELAALPPDRLRRVTGLRTGPVRHRSLDAALAWSYELLCGSEQQLIRCLATLPGDFSLGSACALGAILGIKRDTVARDLARLVAKSFLVADTRSAAIAYRMLETTRAYALERLAEGQDHDSACRLFTDVSLEMAAGRPSFRGIASMSGGPPMTATG
jgi:predicted ATPase